MVDVANMRRNGCALIADVPFGDASLAAATVARLVDVVDN